MNHTTRPFAAGRPSSAHAAADIAQDPAREAGEHADRILHAVRQGSRSAEDDLMARSWMRCLEQHRLHPDRPQRPAVVPAGELAQRQQRLAEVLDCARHEMATLYQQLADPESAVVLTDTDGVILHMVSSPAFADDVTPLGFHVGAVWSEAEAGTNGMGTCLVAASPVAVRREDHFFTQLTSLTCSAVPVFDPQGQMAAVLDVTSRSSLQQQHSLVLLGMTAQMIENRLLELRHPEAHVLHFHSRPEFIHTLHEGKLALDEQGAVVAGNRSALFQLGLRSMSELRGRRLDELLHARLIDLVERCQRNAFHPVVSYGAQGQSRFFVVARPPLADLDATASSSLPAMARTRVTPARSEPRRAPTAAPSLRDPQLAAMLSQSTRAITREIPVLLHGETGAGKEVFARALHAASPKSAGAFVAVNCASLPESLIEAELFGYRAGAFTGALRSGRRGKVLEADRGTLFLDEIGDMPLALQARLLRVLDERKVTPLGAEETLDVDFQLVSASHRPLAQMVAEGRFREDLYYRLCGFEVSLPPLRDRADKRELIDEMLALESDGRGRLAADARALLEGHRWPGNVRQLRHALRSALALAGDDALIGAEHLVGLRSIVVAEPEAPRPVAASTSADNATRGEPAGELPPLNPIQKKEREGLLQLLEEHRWNVSNVAKALDVSRNTLYRKLHKLHIELSHPSS
jgi:sigma-54 dependent transcriptional regulator, acetoin dehydrogenase operon transcriptional activator AcoR